MKTLAFSPAAQADVEGIWDYSADNWGPDQADRYTDEIPNASRAVAAGQRQGMVADERAEYWKLSSG
ncbi:type II toxin-antitoxin system RelE/ParE family toxin [Sphingomonas sp.]|uniref:type II toxin-antitoxin system RelE/ParE family toxin n=1 Tax=Sphingomonas sp. TaxID=28214 RepID=UPI0025EA10F9|nr:type II toxin-antitoxin system RelE/ParE family toxin [Sphingomonas sp.]